MYPNNSRSDPAKNILSHRSQITSQLSVPSTYHPRVMNPYQPRAPMVYSRPPVMPRNQLTESEPLSEYSELQVLMTPMHPIRQMNPMNSPYFRSQEGLMNLQMNPGTRMATANPQNTPTLRKMEMRSQRMRSHDVRTTPHGQPLVTAQAQPSILPPPTPQCYTTPHTSIYSPDQSFVMRSASSSSADRNLLSGRAEFMKINSNNGKTASQVTKLSSSNRKRFLIGSIDQIVHWNKLAKEANFYVIYEVTAILESLSYHPTQKVHKMILRDELKNGIPLQAVFFPIDREIPEVSTGGLITIVGRMIGARKLHVFNMWPTDVNSLAGLKRISFLCQRTLQEACLSDSK